MTPLPKKRSRTRARSVMPQPVGQVTLIDLENSEATPLVQDEIVPYEVAVCNELQCTVMYYIKYYVQ